MIGVLEVLLVKARGIRRRTLIGGATYYATIECGDRVYKSKVSSEGKDYRVWWNQKFRFEFPLSNRRNSWSHLKIKIMDLTILREDGIFLGGTTIFVGGVVEEGLDRGYVEVKPTPYNVVLEDDTYKGEIVVGIKFTLRKERRMEENSIGLEEEKARSGTINSFWWYVRKISHWWKLFSRVCLERNKDKESLD